MKKIGEISLDVLLLAVSTLTFAALPVVGLIPLVYSVYKTYKTGTGDYIKNSVFHINKNKKMIVNGEKHKVTGIFENVFSLKENITGMQEENKQSYFILQALNMFEQLKPTDKKGNKIEYGTTSQAYTKFLLRTLERMGYIENFKCDKGKDSNLSLERLLLGVKQRDKKATMYNMTFELSDKKIDKECIVNLLNSFKVNIEDYSYKEKNGKIFFGKSKTKTKEISNLDMVKSFHKINMGNISNVLKSKLKLVREGLDKITPIEELRQKEKEDKIRLLNSLKMEIQNNPSESYTVEKDNVL